MRILCLNIGMLTTFFGFLGCLILGVRILDESPLIGLLLLSGAPSNLALMIVFDFVKNKIDTETSSTQQTIVHRSNPQAPSSDLKGTPWEHNSAHTKSD